jgi:hypothetical protein
MGRKRTLPKKDRPPNEPAKYSFLVPAALDQKIMETCRLRGLASQSVLLRQILEDNIERYLAEASGGEKASAGVTTPIRVDLNDQVRSALVMAARDYNLDLAGVVRLALAEQLPEILRKAREYREALRQAIEQEQAAREGKTPPR